MIVVIIFGFGREKIARIRKMQDAFNDIILLPLPMLDDETMDVINTINYVHQQQNTTHCP